MCLIILIIPFLNGTFDFQFKYNLDFWIFGYVFKVSPGLIFNAPKFKNNQLIKPAFFTVFQNGVLIQNHVEVQGSTTNVGLPKYNTHGNLPLVLQDHPSLPLSFRNIWIREIAD